MRQFFILRDDVTVPERWTLDDPVTDTTDDAWDFTCGALVDASLATVRVEHAGHPLEFTMTLLDVPVVTSVLGAAIGSIAHRDVQRIPAVVGRQAGYEVVNCLTVLDALDESASEFTRWTPSDGRPDRVGEYRAIPTVRIDPQSVPFDTHCFRLQGFLVLVFVSGEMRRAMESVGCFGAEFENVTS